MASLCYCNPLVAVSADHIACVSVRVAYPAFAAGDVARVARGVPMVAGVTGHVTGVRLGVPVEAFAADDVASVGGHVPRVIIATDGPALLRS